MKTLVLLQKEWKETLRTSKIFVLPAVFVFIAISSPLLAKFTPDFINMMVQYTGQQINIEMPPPTYVDAFVQLFKNIGQMGLLVMLFVFAGTMVEEKTKGTATLILTKGVSRSGFVASKFIYATFFMTAIYLVMTGIFAFYASLLFPDTPWDKAIVALAIVWLYCEMVLAVVVLGSVLCKTYLSSAVFGLMWFFGFSILGSIPIADQYTPGYCVTLALELFQSDFSFAAYAWPIGTSLLVILGTVVIALRTFKYQEF